MVAWGAEDEYGSPLDCSEVQDQLVDVQYSTTYAFAALKADGSVVTWGNSSSGGDCSKVQEQLAADVNLIHSTRYAFAALKADGSVVAWGMAEEGGNIFKVKGHLTTGVQSIYSASKDDDHGFAAVKDCSTIIFWGNVNAKHVTVQKACDSLRLDSSKIVVLDE